MVVLSLIGITAISSCSKAEDNKEFPDVTVTQDTVVGMLKYKLPVQGKDSVISWPFGKATIEAMVDNDSLSAGVVNQDGSFEIKLPGIIPGKYFSSLAGMADTQGGTLKATPETVRILRAIQFRVFYINNGTAEQLNVKLYKLKPDNSIDKTYDYYCYDSEGTYTGTGTTGNTYNWNFIKGWGLVESYKIAAGSPVYNSKSVSNALPEAVWVNF